MPEDLQRTHAELMIRSQLGTRALADLAQHSQVTVRQLLLDGRNFDSRSQFQTFVVGQLALETGRQYLIKVLLIGLADIGAAAQPDNFVDSLGDDMYRFAACGCWVHQRRAGKE